MTNGAFLVAAEQQRQRIPTRFLLLFEEFTNEELASISRDWKLQNAELRAFAGWELDYREAFGVDVYYDDGELTWRTGKDGRKVGRLKREPGIRRKRVS